MKGYVTQVTQLTKDIISLHIHIPHRPTYFPGQFLVVTMIIDGKVEKRPYSFSSSPHWDNVELIIKLRPKGKVSPRMFALQVGDELDLAMPYGHFIIKKPYPEHMVFLAFNQGLSAVLGILRCLEHEHYTGDITLLYSNPTKEDIVYPEELERLTHTLGLKVHHIIWHDQGHIDEEKIKEHCDIEKAHFFLHGNPTVVGHWRQALEHVGVGSERITLDQW